MSVPSVSRIIGGVDNHFRIQGRRSTSSFQNGTHGKASRKSKDTIADIMKYLRPDKSAMKKPDSITRLHMVLGKRIRWVYPLHISHLVPCDERLFFLGIFRWFRRLCSFRFLLYDL